MTSQYPFLENEQSLIAEAYAAGKYYTFLANRRPLFACWSDLCILFLCRHGEKYAYLKPEIRQSFIKGLKEEEKNNE